MKGCVIKNNIKISCICRIYLLFLYQQLKNKQLKKEVVMVKKINRLAGGIKGVLFFLFWVAVAAFMVYMVINY